MENINSELIDLRVAISLVAWLKKDQLDLCAYNLMCDVESHLRDRARKLEYTIIFHPYTLDKIPHTFTCE